MDNLIDILHQINKSLQPSIFDYFTLLIALGGLYLSIRSIRRENTIRTLESIPILLLNNELIFSDFFTYQANDPNNLPLALEIINYSNASAYNIEVNIKPDFIELKDEGLVLINDKNSFKENFTYALNIIKVSEDRKYFSISETKLEPKLFYKSFVIKREAISGNDRILLTSTELMNINDLIESYTCFLLKRSKSFKIPFTVEIRYTDISGKKYKTVYKLTLDLAGYEQIGVDIRGESRLEFSKFQYQIIKDTMESSGLDERKKVSRKKYTL